MKISICLIWGDAIVGGKKIQELDKGVGYNMESSFVSD